MERLFRSFDRRELRIFFLCLLVSAAAHLILAWGAVSWRSPSGEAVRAGGLAERFAQAVNASTDLDARRRARLEELLTRVPSGSWNRGEMAATLQWAAADLQVPVSDSDVVRALDTERSREGRWDIRVWLRWDEGRDASDFLTLAYLVGEGTLKSDFGSHRFWLHLDGPDGSGRVAFETMDCRLYRAGKLSASDLLHRATWVEP